MSNGRVNGTVKWYNPKKGYGFLIRNDAPNSGDVFVHLRDLPGSVTDLAEGQAVSFEIATTKKGQRAVNVVLGS